MSEEIFQTEIQDFYGRRASFEDLSRRLKRRLVNEAKRDLYDVLVTGANQIRNRIITGMRNSPKSGRLYFKYKGKGGKPVFHRASSPGNYPRPDTGDLIRSIQMDENEVAMEVEVGSTITRPNYPLFLEKGTRKMEARPWLERSFDAYEPEIRRKLRAALRDAARRLGSP